MPEPASFTIGALLATLMMAVLLFRRERRIRALVLARSRSVMRGQVSEQLAPLLPGFDFEASDARFLGNPIDYVVFDGYGEGSDVEIVLVEVKTGSARLSPNEQRVKDAVTAGRVRFEVLRLRG